MAKLVKKPEKKPAKKMSEKMHKMPDGTVMPNSKMKKGAKSGY